MTFLADPTSNDRAVIHRLPDHLINQIAAGEVIERPSSVIKELVENSLDARATHIEILLTEGGIEEIQVLDNGQGIYQADLLKTAERHATSKIKTESDLEGIATFGFRGEALSSIASVAHLTLKSRTADSPSGFAISFSKGIPEGPIQEVSAPIGTQVIVKDLFKWIPARFKFLRSSATELSHCQRMVRELALGNPQVKFYLKQEGRTLASWITPHKKDRFLECLKVSWQPLEFKNQREDIQLEAYFAPFHEKVARAELFLFINGRPVRNRPFLSAIRSVFLEHFGPAYEPVGVCYLDIRKDWVDVNVHPQKWEVRCLQQESIYQWLITTFREQLGMAPTLSSPSASIPHSSNRPFSSNSPSLSLRFIAQTRKVLICENESGLILGDIELLSQRSERRRLSNQVKTEASKKRQLEIPVVLNFSQKLSSLISRSQDKLKKLHFELESFGECDFALSCCPHFLSEDTSPNLFESIIAQLVETDFHCPEETVISLICEHTSIETLPVFSLLEELDWEIRNPSSLAQPGILSLAFEDLHAGRKPL